MKKIFSKVIHALKLMHLDPVASSKFISRYPSYLRDRKKFRKKIVSISGSSSSSWPLGFYPILLDRDAHAANLGEYFWQDLFVATRIIKADPVRHIDVGSRVDGFIAHLACVRSVEIFDIRPLDEEIPNVHFTQWDITNSQGDIKEVSDCVSCLHTLEHIGLGRYGDPIDPDGWSKGLMSLASLVKEGGVLWVSVPIGRQRIEFNAHRVFDPKTLCDKVASLNLSLEEFHWHENGALKASASIAEDMKHLATVNYALGIFLFRKS